MRKFNIQKPKQGKKIFLEETVGYLKPSILIGVSS